MNRSVCKSCGAEILFATTEAGKAMPLDAKPQRVAIQVGNYVKIVDGYIPHWATCPSADQHRRPRASEATDGSR